MLEEEENHVLLIGFVLVAVCEIYLSFALFGCVVLSYLSVPM